MPSLRYPLRRVGALAALGLAPLVTGGCLANVTTTSVGSQPTALAVLDTNADGRSDLAVLDGATHTIQLLAQEDGGALARSGVLVPDAGSSPRSLAGGITDTAGAPALAVAEPGADRVALFSSFADTAGPTGHVDFGAGAAPSAVAVADVNRDGFGDLLVATNRPTSGDDGSACGVNGCVTILFGAAAGLRTGVGSGSHVLALGATGDLAPADILVADVTSDGVPDLLVACATDTLVVPALAAGGFDEAHPQRLAATGGLVVTAAHGTTQLAVATASGTAQLFAAGTLAPAGTATKASLLASLPTSGLTVTAASSRSGVAVARLDADATPDTALLFGAYTATGGARVSGTVRVFHSAAVWRTRFGGDLGHAMTGLEGVPRTVGGDLQGPSITGATPPLGRYAASAKLEGPDAGSFRIASFPCAKLDWSRSEDGNCVARVALAPEHAGPLEATLVLSFRTLRGAPAPASVRIPLRGIGVGEGGSAAPRYGVAEDASKYADDGGVHVYHDLETLGMTVNRWTLLWYPEEPTKEFNFLDHALAVIPDDVHVVLSLQPRYALRHGPVPFCSWAKEVATRYPQIRRFIIGNEPNQPRFWRPQFVKGRPVAGAAYERLLAACYDTLKAVDPTLQVIGFGLSPRGNDKPLAKSNVSTSPIRFLLAAAAAYRKSGRRAPLMDALAVHPYPNPNAAADGPGVGYPSPWNYGVPNLDRVKQAVWDGFAGTEQRTTVDGLRLLVDETGWQTTPDAGHRRLYTGKEVTKTVAAATQGSYVQQSIDRWFACDPSVSDVYFFHLIDESDLGRFQSGFEYANGDPKASFTRVKQAIAAGCTGRRIGWTPRLAVPDEPLLLDLALLPTGPVTVAAKAKAVRGGINVTLGAILGQDALADASLAPAGLHVTRRVAAGRPIVLPFRGAIPAHGAVVTVTLHGVLGAGLGGTRTLRATLS
jgi:hypothetical protein